MDNPSKNDAILRAVGASLHNWSLVEISLARFFGSLANLSSGSQTIFAAIINFDTRVTICDRLIEESGLDNLDKKIWTKLSTRLSKFYKKRHEIAHFTLGEVQGRAVIQPFLTLEKLRNGTANSLTVRQISERSGKFIELKEALEWFYDYVPLRRIGHQESRIQALQEPPLVPQLRELAIHSLEEQKSRP